MKAYRCLNNDNEVIYSFPISPSLYKTSIDGKELKEYNYYQESYPKISRYIDPLENS